MKKEKFWFEKDVELTIGQLILVGAGIVVLAIVGGLWLNGSLWQYGMPLA